jgi:alpha-glucoside transport system substrate-binding protein
MAHRRRWGIAASVALSALAASAATASATTPPATGDTAAAAPAECTPNAEQPLKDKTVSIFSSIRSPEDALLAKAWSCFETQTGIKIQHEGSGSFEADLKVRVDGGNAPDLAFIPQPGLVATMAQTGKLVPLTSLEESTKADDGTDWAGYGTVDGKFYGPPFGANTKSWVWYSPSAFKDKGYEIPQTWDDMVALSDKIVADGGTPWCVGAGSGDATGWPLTDWLEDAVLRFEGPEVYDQWVKHEIPFNDPKIADALDKVGAIVKNDKYVLNGVQSIPTTTFQDAGLPLLDGSCYMYRMASFYGNQFPEGTTKGPDGQVNAFYLPVAKAGDKKPMLGGGEIIGAFNDKPETVAVATFLASKDWGNARVPLGNYFTPNKQVDATLISDPLTRTFQEALTGADIFRFDGSDLMPSAVGAGTMWKELVNWVLGESTADALQKIEDSWPKA